MRVVMAGIDKGATQNALIVDNDDHLLDTVLPMTISVAPCLPA